MNKLLHNNKIASKWYIFIYMYICTYAVHKKRSQIGKQYNDKMIT